MRILKIVPSKRFGGSWNADEGDGVCPAFKEKALAIDYAKTRFVGIPEGEIYVYDDNGERVVEVIKIEGQGRY